MIYMKYKPLKNTLLIPMGKISGNLNTLRSGIFKKKKKTKCNVIN